MSDALQIPSRPSSLAQAGDLRAVLEGAVCIPLQATGWLRVSGEDRVRWLNGMVTNSVVGLAPGDGCYNYLLNAQGRIQGTAWAFAEPESLLLETDLSQVAPMMALLDRFIIMDDVELTDISAETAGLLIAGPHASYALAQCGFTDTRTPAQAGATLTELTWHGGRCRLISKPGRLFPTWELWSEPALVVEISAALEAAGVIAATPDVLEWMRMLEGTPKFGVDIRDRDLPQETGQSEALHFSKGCYVGQEIVERIRSRGNVHRVFRGFLLNGALPSPGAALEAGGKSVGELTSVALLPRLPAYPAGLALGLGYIRREALESGQELSYPNGTALPVSLPLDVNQPLPPAEPAHPSGGAA